MRNTTINIPFHLAIGVSDLEKAKQFYGNFLGAKEGRSSHLWVDFHFFGHQLTCHLIKNKNNSFIYSNLVDKKEIPIPHFGVILPVQEFEYLEDQLKKNNIDFYIKPHTRFKNQPGEQKTMFLKDPFGYFIEIKSFTKEQEY